MEIKKKWEVLHEQGRFRPKYPSESVVQFVFRNFERNGKTKVLDLGCGAGRHMLFMAKEGIVPYGNDISSTGIEHCKELLKQNDFKEYIENLNVSSMSKLNYESEFFDGIICYGVLYYSLIDDIKLAINEIYRVLKKGGKAFIVVRTTKDYRYGVGDEIEKNTFVINEKNQDKCAHNENGMSMHFFTELELRDMLKEFNEVQINTIVEGHNNNQYFDSNFVVELKK